MTLYQDGSLEVSDDGRGMPVDIHPEQGMPGVEVILNMRPKPPVAKRTAFALKVWISPVAISIATTEEINASCFPSLIS